MRKKRDPETDQERTVRTEEEAQRTLDKAAAEDSAIQAMVERSIKLRGP
jgi:hypothetical protein